MWPSLLKFLIVPIVIGLVSLGFLSWKHSVENSANADYVKKQYEEILTEKDTQIKKLEKITADQVAIISELNTKNNQINIDLQKLEEYLDSIEAVKDSSKECFDKNGKVINSTGSSQVLKRTIRELSRQAK